MTNKEAREIIIKERDSLKANPLVIVEDCLYEAFDTVIKALEQTSHLIDRPCEACEYHKQTGCSQWSCVFEEVKADADSD